MFITRLETRNFRSIEELTLDLGRLNVLAGPNGAGKSNILLAIDELVQLAYSRGSNTIHGARYPDGRSQLAIEFRPHHGADILRYETSAQYGDQPKITRPGTPGHLTGEQLRQALARVKSVRRLTDRNRYEITCSPNDIDRARGITGQQNTTYPSMNTTRIAKIAAMLQSGNNVLVDGPEEGVHPSALRALAQAIRNTTGQVTIATHSHMLLQHLDGPEVLLTVANSPDGNNTQAGRPQDPQAYLATMM